MNPNRQEAVILNVYDMHKINRCSNCIGIGVYHTGVEVYQTEYAFRGHPFEFSGIFEMTPRQEKRLGQRYKYKKSIRLGYTNCSKEKLQEIISELDADFIGNQYHLLRNNCNNFSRQFCKRILSKRTGFPKWINRLAWIANSIPFSGNFLPKRGLHSQGDLDENNNNIVGVDLDKYVLSWLLSPYNARLEGLIVQQGGWINLNDILAHRKFNHWKSNEVNYIVRKKGSIFSVKSNPACPIELQIRKDLCLTNF